MTLEQKWVEYYGPQPVLDLDSTVTTALRCYYCPGLVGAGWLHINFHEELKKQGRPVLDKQTGERWDRYNFWTVNAIRLRDWEKEWLLDGEL